MGTAACARAHKDRVRTGENKGRVTLEEQRRNDDFDQETIDLREVFLMLRKNLLLIILLAVLFAVVGGVCTKFLITPLYQAKATMIVNSREEGTQTVVTNDQINSAKQLVETYSVILKSDTVLEKTIEDLELNYTYAQLVDKVSVSAVNDTQIMQITVTDANPDLAQQIVENIVLQAPEIIIKTVKAGSVEVISQPKAEHIPVNNNLVRNTALAGFLGACVAAGIGFIRMLLNNKFMTGEDVTRRLGLPVLGVIPRINIAE